MPQIYTPDPSLRDDFVRYMSSDSAAERAAIIEQLRDDTPEKLAEFVLLVSQPHNDDFLDPPNVAIKPTSEAPRHVDPTSLHEVTPSSRMEQRFGADNQAGEKIGSYKLLQKIGEGGFGAVYMAQQSEPVRRKVALKIIKPGMDSTEIIARFEAERQALAMMEHPNVAKVLDAGTTESGRPYFVMELVHGTPITDFCDENRLSNQDRLKLFVDVCRAIQHSHIKGIIHRDLKPSNVLVTMNDDKPMPKVIDFGVSKALSQPLTEKTMFTAYGQMIGTPLYMSPEQAQFSAKDVDVRSDVYSLGVLLYELLTGHTPFDRADLQGTSLDEMRRMIREVDPPRPSARVSTLQAQDRSTVSDLRRADQRKLSHALVGELDWIVMKALEKDRERRYESANEFAADVKRFLDDEAVEARPQSVGYRLGKFSRHHRVALTTASLIVLALVAGFSTAIWQAVAATQERNRTAEQRDRAVNAEKVVAAVNEFLNEDLLAQANPENQSDPDVKLRTVIDQAADKLETRFVNQPLVEAAIRHTLAESYHGLSEHRQALNMAERAAELRGKYLGKNDKATLESTLLVAKSLSGRGDYLASEVKSQAITKRARSALGKEHPLTLESRRHLGRVLISLGRYEEAQKTLSEVLRLQKESIGSDHEFTLRTLASLGVLHWEEGNYSEATSAFRKVVERRQRLLGSDHPHTLDAVNDLGGCLTIQGKYAEAKGLLQECLDIKRRVFGQTSYQAAVTQIALARVLEAEGHFNEAKAILEKAAANLSEGYGEQHPATLAAKCNLASLNRDGGNHEEALELLNEVVNFRRERLGDHHPNTLAALVSLANVHSSQRRYSKAEKIYDEVVSVTRRVLGEEHPDTVSTAYNLATIYILTDRLDEAASLCREVAEKRTKLLGASHAETVQALDVLAVIYKKQGRLDEAEKVLVPLVVTCAESLGPEHPRTLSARNNLASLYSNTERRPKAEEIFRENFKVLLSKMGPTHPQTLFYMFNVGANLSDQSRFEEAEQVYLDLIEQGTEAWGDAQESVMCARIQLAKDYRERGLIDLSIETIRNNLEVDWQVDGVDQGQMDSSRELLRLALMRRSESLVLAERYDDALDVLSEIRELSPDRKQAESLVGLLVYLDKQDAAASFSEQLWQRAQAEENGPSPTSRWVVGALLMPHHGLDPESLVGFMIPLVESENKPIPRLGLGLAHYRAGHFTQAAEVIDTSDESPTWIRPLTCFFSAMAHQRIGETDRANELYDLGVDRMNEITPTPASGIELNKRVPPRWALWCLYQGLKREAAKVVGVEIATPTYLPPLEEPITVE